MLRQPILLKGGIISISIFIWRGLNRAMGELQETLHHIGVAFKKRYFSLEEYEGFRGRYLEAARMLRGLERSIEASRER
jgi:hypothetical protein